MLVGNFELNGLKVTKVGVVQPFFLYLKCQQNHSNKPMSGAGSPSCRPGSVQLNLYKNIKRQIDPHFTDLHFSFFFLPLT